MSREMYRQSRETKVAVIREEFIALTKDPLVAVVLNQLVYWTQRVKDFDFFLREEQSLKPACTITPRHGWIYKTADDLIEETMLGVSRSTMLRYLSTLIAAGWVDKRNNSADKWDKTTQYRVNLRKLQRDLLHLGYTLPGERSLAPSLLSHTPVNEVREAQNAQAATSTFEDEISRFQIETPEFQNEASKFQNRTSNTEITTETIAEITKEAAACARVFESEGDEEKTDVLTIPLEQIPQAMLEIWKTQVGQEGLLLTEARKSQLLPLLQRFFSNDLASWEQFCKRITSSRFLMGEGTRKWRVSLDWILLEANVRKVLEGNYDNPKEAEGGALSQLGFRELSFQQKLQIQATLKKIQDPTWKQWCSQLQFNPRFSSYVMPWQLEELVGARFLGIEEDRLAWISCIDPRTLNRVSNLRFQILSVIQKTYPSVSAIRTCLEGENPLLEGELSHSRQGVSLEQPLSKIFLEEAFEEDSSLSPFPPRLGDTINEK